MKKLINRDQIAGMNIHYLFYSLEYFLDTQKELGFETIELWGGAPHFYLDSMGYLAARRDLLKKQIQTDPAKKTYWSYLKQAKFREIEPYWPSLSMEVAESINRVILGEDTQDELEQLSERISRIRRAKYEKE